MLHSLRFWVQIFIFSDVHYYTNALRTMYICSVYSIQMVNGNCAYDTEAVLSIISAGFTIDQV